MFTTFSKMEECSMTFNSTWQEYRGLDARFAKVSTILFSDLGTLDT